MDVLVKPRATDPILRFEQGGDPVRELGELVDLDDAGDGVSTAGAESQLLDDQSVLTAVSASVLASQMLSGAWPSSANSRST